MNIEVCAASCVYVPHKKHNTDAGYDCVAAEKVILLPFKPTMVDLGFKVAIPKGYEGQLRGRSGLATKGVTVHTGTIDCNFRGNVKAIMTYISSDPNDAYHIEIGNRIAQLVFNKIESPALLNVPELTVTARGEDGFGSTGI